MTRCDCYIHIKAELLKNRNVVLRLVINYNEEMMGRNKCE